MTTIFCCFYGLCNCKIAGVLLEAFANVVMAAVCRYKNKTPRESLRREPYKKFI